MTTANDTPHLATDDGFRDELRRFLADEFRSDQVEIARFERSGGGHSWETYTVELVGVDTRYQKLAVKRQPSTGMLGTYDIHREVDLLWLAAEIGVPAPAVIAYQAGGDGVRGFYVTSFVDGVVPTPNDVCLVVPDPADRRAIGLQLARIMAKLHTYPVVRVPPHVSAGLDDPTKAGTLAVQKWRQSYLDGSPMRVPVLDFAYAWLGHRAGDVTGRSALIHNDLHVGNFIVKTDQVAAVLDWETSEISDPACDIAKFNLPTWQGSSGQASGLIPLSDFLAEYERHGGEEPTEDALRFWTVLSLTKSATILLTSSYRYAAGAHRDIRWGNLGFRMLTHMRVLVELLERGQWGVP